MTGRGYNGTSVLNASPHWAVRREPREGGIPMRGIANARLIYSESSGCRGQKDEITIDRYYRQVICFLIKHLPFTYKNKL